MQLVVDASVAIKWFFKEENWEKADVVLEDMKQTQTTLLLPDIFYYEIGSVLLKKNESEERAAEILSLLQLLHPVIVPIETIPFTTIYQLAKHHTLSFYDASYLALVQNSQCRLITADKKLYEKTHSIFPLIQLL